MLGITVWNLVSNKLFKTKHSMTKLNLENNEKNSCSVLMYMIIFKKRLMV